MRKRTTQLVAALVLRHVAGLQFPSGTRHSISASAETSAREVDSLASRDDAGALTSRGLAAESANDPMEALDSYEAALERDPSHVPAIMAPKPRTGNPRLQ